MNWKDLDRSGPELIQVISRDLLHETEETAKLLVGIAGVPTEI
jgi:hypothetical protein